MSDRRSKARTQESSKHRSSKINDNRPPKQSSKADNRNREEKRRPRDEPVNGSSKSSKGSSKEAVKNEVKAKSSDDERRREKRDKRRDSDRDKRKDAEREHRKDSERRKDPDREKRRDRDSGKDREKDRERRKEKETEEQRRKRKEREREKRREREVEKPEPELKRIEPPVEAVIAEAKEEEPEEEEGDDYNYDDEEFEDYDDDFESDPGDDEDEDEDEDDETDYETESTATPEVAVLSDTQRLKIKEAMALENSRVGSSTPPNLPSSPTNTPVPSSPAADAKRSRHNFRVLDFAAAQKSQAKGRAMSKTTQRGRDLVRLIELDSVYFDLVELKPQTEYELYMKSFGRTESEQKHTQYNEDSVDREAMTEPEESRSCWSQHPPDGALVSAHEGDAADEGAPSETYDPATLGRFIALSAQIVTTLLEERASSHGYSHTFKPISTSKFSDTSAEFPAHPLAAHRAPIHCTPVTAQTFLVCYTRPKVDTSPLPTHGLSCVWSLQDIHQPTAVMISNAAHRCACISPYNPTIVFVGCEDGSLSVWDLNEPAHLHSSFTVEGHSYTSRSPTYNTSSVQVAEAHHSKITHMEAVRLDQDLQVAASFQIASLDETGILIVWVVISVTDASLSGSQIDLGLRPGGRVKLVKSALININFPQNPTVDLFPEVRTFSFQQSFTDTSLYFISTDQGTVVKASRNPAIGQPTTYAPEMAVPAIVGSVDFNKFNWKYFLAGTADGRVCLFYVDRAAPLLVLERFTKGRPLRSVCWSRASSTLFYAMDSASKLYLWDLAERDSAPITTESYESRGLLSFTELLPSAGPPVLILTFKDGSLAAHSVKKSAVRGEVDNITKLQTYLATVL